ncbi:FAD-binding domain-containing protein [Alexandriicola marinus]|uniref:FAD-binding domain-containing protein n=1 Tax=Alexandriicola marinus TaxID=2081710 RepID=UPI001EEE1356|nr:FAD-binding domain-containing protein [Alexandriicola marinus]
MQTDEATRSRALQITQDFVPRMGKAYAAGRNHDRGPGRHRDVSQLSAHVRRRLITEQELVAAALDHHGAGAAEKFIQEVLWRGYFKGWLEQRPQVWAHYVSGLDADLAMLDRDDALRARVEAAERGETGLACFDAWARELIETGYLHNHARMWFASIWIFTFRLPWRIGADFFLRHLLDGDPASNTCSWRWVAGLHTRGKAYEAKAWNIAKFTGNRFTPRENDLATDVIGLEDQEPGGLPEIVPLRSCTPPWRDVPTALVLTEEDCRLEDFDLLSIDIRGAVMLQSSHLRSPRTVAGHVSDFEAGALRDAADRIGHPAVELRADAPEGLALWAEQIGAQQIAMPYVPTGPLADWITRARPALEARGIVLTEWQREWDRLIWPHATAGFFKVKKKIPQILRTTGLT